MHNWLNFYACTWVQALTEIESSGDSNYAWYAHEFNIMNLSLSDVESGTGRLIHSLELMGTLMWTEAPLV